MTSLLQAKNLACPIDGLVLTVASSKSFVCASGHNYDLSKQGYLNLLLVQHKSSRDPGDSKEMVLARKQFLESGAFEAIGIEIAKIAKDFLDSDNNSAACILDAGCGEGFYLRCLAQRTNDWENLSELVLIGLDISKWAVQSAANSNKQINWLVGTNYHLPLLPNSVDLIVCAFGFPCFEEFHKILKPGGAVLLVDPAPRHLIEMRALIYPELTNLDKEISHSYNKSQFKLSQASHLRYHTEVEGRDQLRNLLMMTPHYFKSGAEGQARLLQHSGMALLVDLNLQLLSKIVE